MIEIRRAENEDLDQIWTILHEAFLKGHTYACFDNVIAEKNWAI